MDEEKTLEKLEETDLNEAAGGDSDDNSIKLTTYITPHLPPEMPEMP